MKQNTETSVFMIPKITVLKIKFKQMMWNWIQIYTQKYIIMQRN